MLPHIFISITCFKSKVVPIHGAGCNSFCIQNLSCIPDGDALHRGCYNKWTDNVAGPQMDVRVHGLLSSTAGNFQANLTWFQSHTGAGHLLGPGQLTPPPPIQVTPSEPLRCPFSGDSEHRSLHYSLQQAHSQTSHKPAFPGAPCGLAVGGNNLLLRAKQWTLSRGLTFSTRCKRYIDNDNRKIQWSRDVTTFAKRLQSIDSSRSARSGVTRRTRKPRGSGPPVRMTPAGRSRTVIFS